ncbi:selenocysteine-specific translation elongation factor [Necropsobacter rosorum]|uniref:selenocysteine-specific translation elongation factor n=1 Tax=Necropsobacter rosorum TaxID=908285 RepID=UPI000509EE6F
MIIVTAGHVDHGKTALLQALTGTDTAHLPEEKKRGMTIDLGYAYLPLNDRILGFIDVPGHEKFIPNMLAGLGGIHYAMLIIAADEGIQAQTREHLTILRLLHIDQLIVVISKADRADEAQITQLTRQLQQDYPFLAQSPLFITSAHSGRGIAQLRDYLAQLPNPAQQDKPFRYAIDRVFTVKGAGTVVTGTAFAGVVRIEDELYLSGGQKVRVKNIHAQNQPNALGVAGQRLALNISADLNRTLIERGDWLLAQPPLPPTERVTLWLEAAAPVAESQPVHIYHAAARTTGRLHLLQEKGLAAQQQGLAELILDQPLFLAYGDKLILRSGDAKSVLAGAKTVEINSPKRHKRTAQRLDYLCRLLQTDSLAERLRQYLEQQPVALEKLAWAEQLSAERLQELIRANQDVVFQDWGFNRHYPAQQAEKLIATLTDYHAQHGDQLGLSKARLYRIAAINQPEKLIYHIIEQLLAAGQIEQTRGWLHTPEHKIRFSAQEQHLWQTVLAQFEQQNGQALWVRELAERLGIPEEEMRNFLYKAGKLGYLTPIVKDRFLLTENIYAYARLIKRIIAEQGSISVNRLRDELNWGRKITVQLMEYFDRCGFLRRKGNAHILRDAEIFEV